MFNFGGGMLTGHEIERQIKKGNINITPFNKSQLNPNSYNLKLDPEMFVYTSRLDMNKENTTRKIIIPETGYTLKPGVLYIGRSVETTGTDKFVPMINGRSSGGRLGISIHVCAGFGDIGFNGTWTLEITAVEPVVIYPYTEIAQVCFFKPAGKVEKLYRGKYYNQQDATPSKFYQDMRRKENGK